MEDLPERGESNLCSVDIEYGETLSTREAAAALGVNERTVRRAVARGDLRAIKQGVTYRIPQGEIERYAAVMGGVASPRPIARVVPFPDPMDAFAPLPAPLSSFVGREAELSQLTSLLIDPSVRLVTLTGPGGIGKTRLTLTVAGAVRGRFRDGVVFVPLAAVTQPELMLSAIADAIGLRESTSRDRRTQLHGFLRARRMLLILDNVEQILAVAPDVAQLVAVAPELTVLVTSRAPLRLGGEHEIPLQPLGIASALATPAALLASDAGRLFVERARAHDPSFEVNDASAPIVAEICAQLDGLPLAIELAAARANVLSPRQLRDRLERRLPLLTGLARDLPARHRTMRDAVAWSYDLLTDDEQRLFRQLSVFVGGCTLDAATRVTGCRGDRVTGEASSRAPTSDALDLVTTLVEHSLLQREIGLNGEPRFRMLETIREYGLEQLERDEESAARAAHAHYYLELTRQLRALVKTQAMRAPFDRLAADDANLGAALDWLEGHEAANFVAMVAAIAMYWYAFSHLHDAAMWLDRALARQDSASTADRGRLLIAYGELLMLQGDFVRAELVFARGLPLLRDEGEPVDLAMALISRGASLNYGGKYEAGRVHLSEALVVAEPIADRTLRAAACGGALANLSVSARGEGDLDQATACIEDAVRWYHGQELDLAETRAFMDRAGLARDQEQHGLAVAYYLAAIERTGDRGDMRIVAEALTGIACAATVWEQPSTALQLLGAAEALRERVGLVMLDPTDLANNARDLAVLRETVGDHIADAVLAEGRTLPPGEAVAIAIGVTEPVRKHEIARGAASQTLTRREQAVLGLLVEGQSDREIAATLYMSPRTAEWHVRSILAKLGVTTRREAIRKARTLGFA
jgi:non-specific serine/threonine protein kinase